MSLREAQGGTHCVGSQGPCVCSVTFGRLLNTGVQLRGVPEEMKMATQRSVAMEGDGKVIISRTVKETELIYLDREKKIRNGLVERFYHLSSL